MIFFYIASTNMLQIAFSQWETSMYCSFMCTIANPPDCLNSLYSNICRTFSTLRKICKIKHNHRIENIQVFYANHRDKAWPRENRYPHNIINYIYISQTFHFKLLRMKSVKCAFRTPSFLSVSFFPSKGLLSTHRLYAHSTCRVWKHAFLKGYDKLTYFNM